jgi:two-component system response regulator FixJ
MMASVIDDLTSREVAVLNFITEGLSNRQIALRLGLSTRTVEYHRANVMQKLRARNAVALVGKVRVPSLARRA